MTREAILLALVLKPHAIKHAPMNEDPRYPAGRVKQGTPPFIRVEPPSSAANGEQIEPISSKSQEGQIGNTYGPVR